MEKGSASNSPALPSPWLRAKRGATSGQDVDGGPRNSRAVGVKLGIQDPETFLSRRLFRTHHPFAPIAGGLGGEPPRPGLRGGVLSPQLLPGPAEAPLPGGAGGAPGEHPDHHGSPLAPDPGRPRLPAIGSPGGASEPEGRGHPDPHRRVQRGKLWGGGRRVTCGECELDGQVLLWAAPSVLPCSSAVRPS